MDPANAQQWKSRMGDLAFGTALHAAARDYKKELKAQEKAAQAQRREAAVDLDKLADDPELEKLHADRLAALKRETEKRMVMQRKGHGEYRQITEPDFLEEVTGSELVVCHFFHKEFSRCKIIDKHLSTLCTKYFATKFIKLDVEVRDTQTLLPWMCDIISTNFVNKYSATKLIKLDMEVRGRAFQYVLRSHRTLGTRACFVPQARRGGKERRSLFPGR
eukprot:jgi/Mesvir1/25087/Mv21553-RA.1